MWEWLWPWRSSLYLLTQSPVMTYSKQFHAYPRHFMLLLMCTDRHRWRIFVQPDSRRSYADVS